MAATTTERPGARAQIRYLRVSASKVRVVLDLIRGLPVGEASRVLQLSERGVSRDVAKLLDSAVANAEHNEEIPGEELMVSACWADEGPTLKRFRPRARGRAGRINKRTSHVTIVVSRLTDAELDTARERAEAKGAAQTNAAEARRRRVAASRSPEADETEQTDEVAADEVVADEQSAVEATNVEAPEAVEVEAEAVDSAEADNAEVGAEAADDTDDAEAADDTDEETK